MEPHFRPPPTTPLVWDPRETEQCQVQVSGVPSPKPRRERLRWQGRFGAGFHDGMGQEVLKTDSDAFLSQLFGRGRRRLQNVRHTRAQIANTALEWHGAFHKPPQRMRWIGDERERGIGWVLGTSLGPVRQLNSLSPTRKARRATCSAPRAIHTAQSTEDDVRMDSKR